MDKGQKIRTKREKREKYRIDPEQAFDEFLAIMEQRTQSDNFTCQAKHVVNRYYLDQKQYPKYHQGDVFSVGAFLSRICDTVYKDRYYVELLKKNAGKGNGNTFLITVFK